MYKHSALVLIAAMVIATAAIIAPAPTAVAAGTATVSPAYARANTRIKFTVVVTNGYSSDNIDNVRIVASSGFVNPVGYAENLVIAADNIENSVAPLTQAGENLKLAAENIVSAGTDLYNVGDNLAQIVVGDFQAENVTASAGLADENAFYNVSNAANYLKLAGDALDNATENITYVAYYLNLAGTLLCYASGVEATGNTENIDNINSDAGENVWSAGDNIIVAAQVLGENMNLENVSYHLNVAADNLGGAAAAFNNTNLSTYFGNAATLLGQMALKLSDADNFIDNAAYAFGVAENYLYSAGENLAGVANLSTAGNNLKVVALALENVENAILLDENLFRAAENLLLASDNLDNVALELGADLGMDNMRSASDDLDNAGENMKVGTLNLSIAGDRIKSAATKLSGAATTMEATVSGLSPSTWTLSSGSGYVQFDAIGDNVITPGNQQSFVFIWTTPNITTETNYTISVLVSKEETTYTAYENLGGFTVTVDGQVPTLTINVTQEGVSQTNLVGNKLDNGRATITIVASEALSSLGEVHVENAGNDENLLPPIPGSAFTTTDNIIFTYQYITIGEWDDNTVAVRVLSATDLAGNENTSGMENTITVDTRAPVLVDNGLSGILSGMRENVVQAGTGTIYRYVDNSGSRSMVIIVEDNISAADNGTRVASVTVNGVAATRDPMQDNRWTLSLTLDEGYNSAVVVRATDTTGNWVEENVENIFIDTQAPTVSFDTIAGKTWTDGVEIADNTPQIRITITDPGYPTSGLGVARENLFVYLDNDDNVNNGTPAFGGLLENMAAWDPATGVFENIIDNFAENQGKGLVGGTYYIIVVCNDNLQHAGDNENWVIAKHSFVIDVTAPTMPTPTQALNPLYGTTISSPLVTVTNELTIRGEGLSTEAGATIKIYIRNASTGAEVSTDTTTVDTDGKWSKTITLPEGGVTFQIEVTCIDVAGNESTPQLYGFVLLDGTAPSVTISAPCTAGEIHTTADPTVVVSGSITKDTWETYNSGTRAVTATVQVGSATPGVLTINSDGTFTVSAALSEGTNTITIRAVDSAGNSDSKTITVIRTVTPWATYAIILVIVALILAAIAIFRKR